MIRRPVSKVWLFAFTMIAGSLAITFYTAKLSLELANEQEKFNRSSISALVRDTASKELSDFEDFIYAATFKSDAKEATREMLERVEWIAQIDHFLFSENASERREKHSSTNLSGDVLTLDQVTKAILFESSNKLRSRLIYMKPLNPIKEGGIVTAGLSLKKASSDHHFIIYLDMNTLLNKIARDLEPLAAISLGYRKPLDLKENDWITKIPTLDVAVSIELKQQNMAGTGIQALKTSIFTDDNLLTVVLLNLALWAVVILMLREHYYRLKAQKNAFEISTQAETNSNLAILGELATSIAHEINQPLAVMKMRTSMIFEDDQNELSREKLNLNLKIIKDQVHRCAEIVRSVQNLNSRAEPGAEKIKLDDFFRDIEPILKLQTEKYDGRLNLSCPKDLYVEFNKTALEQIALNLSRNGFEAMNHLPKTKRILTIKAKCNNGLPKPSTVIEFIDRGTGLTKAKQAKVFDAFYSTKEAGTGLGLALSKTLAEQNNANILVNSTEGVGSCFQVRMETGKSVPNATLDNRGGQA